MYFRSRRYRARVNSRERRGLTNSEKKVGRLYTKQAHKLTLFWLDVPLLFCTVDKGLAIACHPYLVKQIPNRSGIISLVCWIAFKRVMSIVTIVQFQKSNETIDK
jgi:hypothetical protein